MIDFFYLDFLIPMAAIPFFTLLLAQKIKPSAKRGVILVAAFLMITIVVLSLQEMLNSVLANLADYDSLGRSLRMTLAAILAFPVTFLALAYLERSRK